MSDIEESGARKRAGSDASEGRQRDGDGAAAAVVEKAVKAVEEEVPGIS